MRIFQCELVSSMMEHLINHLREISDCLQDLFEPGMPSYQPAFSRV